MRSGGLSRTPPAPIFRHQVFMPSFVELKESLEKLFGGEWQVVIGEGEIGGYFSQKYIANYI